MDFISFLLQELYLLLTEIVSYSKLNMEYSQFWWFAVVTFNKVAVNTVLVGPLVLGDT